jgi:hypothetical protein
MQAVFLQSFTKLWMPRSSSCCLHRTRGTDGVSQGKLPPSQVPENAQHHQLAKGPSLLSPAAGEYKCLKREFLPSASSNLEGRSVHTSRWILHPASFWGKDPQARGRTHRKCRNADTCNGVHIPWRKRIPRCCGRRQSSLILMTRSCELRKHVVVGAGTRYGRFDWISLSVYVAVGMSCPAAGVAELGHNCSGGRAGRREPAFLHPVHVVRICLRHVDLRGFCAARRDELILFRPL